MCATFNVPCADAADGAGFVATTYHFCNGIPCQAAHEPEIEDHSGAVVRDRIDKGLDLLLGFRDYGLKPVDIGNLCLKENGEVFRCP